MTTIKPTSPIYVNSQFKSGRAEKAKKFIRVAVPVIATAVVTKKALAGSGVKLADIFKNGNISKVWKSAMNVLSAPVNFIQNKFAKVGSKLGCAKLASSAPATGASGLKATLGTVLIAGITTLASRVINSVVDYCSNKIDNWLKPKEEQNKN